MATTEEVKSVITTTALATESEAEHKPRAAAAVNRLVLVDLALRLLLLLATSSAVTVMTISKETVVITMPLAPISVTFDAKFNYSPALIYLVAANSVVCLYSIVTAFVSARTIRKSSPASTHLFILALFDVLMVSVMASATGAGASVAYVAKKGNSHIGWAEICSMFGKFCLYSGSSISVSLVASAILILLTAISAFSLRRKSQ